MRVRGRGERSTCSARGLGGITGILRLHGSVSYAGVSLLEVLGFVVWLLYRYKRLPL